MNPIYETDFLTLFHADCMEIMKQYPDKHFDLAIVDPPYDFSITATHYASQRRYGHNQETRPNSGIKIGGNYANALQEPPKEAYFKELFRISKNQIIWGGNYFTQNLTPSMCWICWYKMNGDKSYFSDFELAWTSFQKRTYMFKEPISKSHKGRIHPTQKPISLYEFILQNFANENDKIIDTHLGSGSIALAVHKANQLDKMNLHLTACEIDKEYIYAAIHRIKEHTRQKSIFDSLSDQF